MSIPGILHFLSVYGVLVDVYVFMEFQQLSTSTATFFLLLSSIAQLHQLLNYSTSTAVLFHLTCSTVTVAVLLHLLTCSPTAPQRIVAALVYLSDCCILCITASLLLISAPVCFGILQHQFLLQLQQITYLFGLYCVIIYYAHLLNYVIQHHPTAATQFKPRIPLLLTSTTSTGGQPSSINVFNCYNCCINCTHTCFHLVLPSLLLHSILFFVWF